jgi:hypothetical protein
MEQAPFDVELSSRNVIFWVRELAALEKEIEAREQEFTELRAAYRLMPQDN